MQQQSAVGASLRIVLVVDDQERPRRALGHVLRESGYEVVEAEDGRAGWHAFQGQVPDLVITDMVMPHSDGIDLLGRIRSRSEVPVILFTTHASVEAAITAFKSGADEFVASQDVDVDALLAIVERTLRRRRLPPGEADLPARLVGESELMRRLRQRVLGLAPLRTPVLISGEPGSGRNSLVGALHDLGAASGGELRTLDARSFSPESALRGAGTLHVTQIERLGEAAQGVLTRMLISGERRDTARYPRFLASTHDRLLRRVAEGRFRADLAQLLLRFHVALPPLRRRPEDIPRLAAVMAERIAESLARRPARLSAAALEFLREQRWPGNLVQLESTLERAIAFSRGAEIRRQVVEEVYTEAQESLASIREHHRVRERELLLTAIRETGGNASQTAERLGKSRSAIYRLIEKHGILLRREQ